MAVCRATLQALQSKAHPDAPQRSARRRCSFAVLPSSARVRCCASRAERPLSPQQSRSTPSRSTYDTAQNTGRGSGAATLDLGDQTRSSYAQPANNVPDPRQDPPTPRAVDAQAHEALLASRNRLSKKINELNRGYRRLQETVSERDEALSLSYELIANAASEFENLAKLSQGAAAGVQFGVDREGALSKILKLQTRLERMQAAVRDSQTSLGAHVKRGVPVVWCGLANEVRLMGSFDDWTEGVLLSSEGSDDNVFGRFEADVQLVPGEYRVKFLVDGKWRLAPEWPTEDADGDTNNIMVVENDLYSGI